MYFKNSLRGATNIPLGVIRVLFKIICNKGKYSYINTKCYKDVVIAIQHAHRHIKPRKLTFNIDSRVRGIGNKINTLGSSVHSYMGHMACISMFEN